MLNLEDKEWKDFVIGEVFNVLNSKPYHKKDLKISNNYKNSIPYISRTNRNNGVEEIIQKEDNFKINKKNTIAFGAENATFFLQPFEYITGNKIYTINHKQINKFNGLFIQQALNTSIKDCGFSYGQGLTGTRAKRRNVLLPINKNNEPDYEFMEEYTKSIIDKKLNSYKKYAQTTLEKLQYKKIDNLQEKEWREFVIEDLFDIQIGKSIDGNKIDKFSGKVPYITRKETSNGYDGFISYDKKYLYENAPVITIGNETAMPFVQTAKNFFTGTKVNIMKSKNEVSENVLFFVSQSIKQQKNKYSYSITINSTRLKRQKILLPINSKDEPDYAYMEQYIINMKHKKIKQYLDYLEKQKKDS